MVTFTRKWCLEFYQTKQGSAVEIAFRKRLKSKLAIKHSTDSAIKCNLSYCSSYFSHITVEVPFVHAVKHINQASPLYPKAWYKVMNLNFLTIYNCRLFECNF